MAASQSPTILNALPTETLDRVFWLLSDSRVDIGACRLTCRAFCELNARYLITYAVLATNLRSLHKLHRVLSEPDYKKYVRQLVVVEDYEEVNDRENYEIVLEDANWKTLKEDEKVLWRDLSRYSEYPGEGPERFEWSESDTDDDKECFFSLLPDYADYIRGIRMNMLIQALKSFPMLSEVVLMDYSSAVAESLIIGDLLPESTVSDILHRPYQYQDGDDFETLIYLIGACREGRLKSISVGPFSNGKSAAFWEERRHKAVVVAGRYVSCYLPLGSIHGLWELWPDKVTKVMHGLQRLQLPLKVDGYSLKDTSLSALLRIAAPTLVNLSLEAKGLVRTIVNGSANNRNPVQDGPGCLSFARLFGELSMPCLSEFELRGWLYGQSEMQHFLLRHKVRRLRLIENLMLEGDIASLDEFARDKLELVEIEIF